MNKLDAKISQYIDVSLDKFFEKCEDPDFESSAIQDLKQLFDSMLSKNILTKKNLQDYAPEKLIKSLKNCFQISKKNSKNIHKFIFGWKRDIIKRLTNILMIRVN